MGTVGPWHEPHFSFKDAQQEGNELQREYFVARSNAVAALKVVAGLRDQLAPILGVSEIRSVTADKLWLSTAYGHNVVAIHNNSPLPSRGPIGVSYSKWRLPEDRPAPTDGRIPSPGARPRSRWEVPEFVCRQIYPRLPF